MHQFNSSQSSPADNEDLVAGNVKGRVEARLLHEADMQIDARTPHLSTREYHPTAIVDYRTGSNTKSLLATSQHDTFFVHRLA